MISKFFSIVINILTFGILVDIIFRLYSIKTLTETIVLLNLYLFKISSIIGFILSFFEKYILDLTEQLDTILLYFLTNNFDNMDVCLIYLKEYFSTDFYNILILISFILLLYPKIESHTEKVVIKKPKRIFKKNKN